MAPHLRSLALTHAPYWVAALALGFIARRIRHALERIAVLLAARGSDT